MRETPDLFADYVQARADHDARPSAISAARMLGSYAEWIVDFCPEAAEHCVAWLTRALRLRGQL